MSSMAGIDASSTSQLDASLGTLPDAELARRIDRSVRSVRTRTEPVCTVENGRDAVLTCLLVRAAVDSQSVATMERLTG